MKLYQDQFAINHLPDKQFQPDYIYNDSIFELDSSLNCVERLLDNHIKEGRGNSVAILTFNETWKPVLGEQSSIVNHYNELTFCLSQTVIKNKTRQILQQVNEVDLSLNNEGSDCGVKEREFGLLDAARIESSKNESHLL